VPKIWEDAVKAIRKSSPNVNEYAVATSALQRAGELRKGTREATKLGEKRGAMTRKERHERPLHADGGEVAQAYGERGLEAHEKRQKGDVRERLKEY
jgi:hypothetical protein